MRLRVETVICAEMQGFAIEAMSLLEKGNGCVTHHSKSIGPDKEVGPCAGYEANGIVAGLHVLPEVDVAVVENVCMQIHVVEALGTEHHGDIVSAIQQRNCLEEEILLCHLQHQHRGFATDQLAKLDAFHTNKSSLNRTPFSI